MSSNQYFASKAPSDTANILLSKASTWYNDLYSNGYLLKVRESWMAYHGAYYNSVSGGHKITFGGEQGELVQIAINHYRNIARHILEMITSNRPSFQARATNTDYKSLVQAKLGNDLLDYYMREKRMEKYLRQAVEYSIVLGSGYIKMEWNATSGEIYDMNEETNTPIYEGDVAFTNMSPYDVVFDTTKEDQDHSWVLCRSFKNKFDLAAKYPELENKIKGLQTKSDIMRFRMEMYSSDETEDVPVYEFYHKKTEAMPEGRYILFLDTNIILMDSPMPYRSLPVYRISPSDILGTPFGYTPMFDLLPIQEAVNSLYSTILTNQHAFGVQNIYVPRGADVTMKSLEGGLNIIEGNASAGKPEAMNLTSTPGEVFSFLKTLETQMEIISGVNSVARGNPESSLKSGTALALVQSMALQFISGLQQQYVELIEDVGTGLLDMLKDFAAVPRVAMIAGKSSKSYVAQDFNGDDLSQVQRVIVDMGNPLSKCLAKGTKVLMVDGSISLVENIRVGEQIMGPDSKPRTVSIVNTGKEMMYEITSKDKHRNIKYGCNESHILTLKYCSDDFRYNAKKGDIIDISIRDYLKLPKRQKRLLQGFTVGVEFSKKDLIVPPYILGAWLGDGHSETTALTTMDQELVDVWENYAKSLNLSVRIQENAQPNKSKVYFITSGKSHGASDRNAFKNELKSMEVIKNKHIPDLYLKSSTEQRMELLAGLLDTDGSLSNETFIFTQKSNRLTDNVIFLAKSLGFRVTNSKFMVNDAEYNRITIGGATHKIPTILKRKRAIEKIKARDPLNYGINVESVGFGTYYGFTLKEEPHFLLGDFTVTHNTTAGKLQMVSEMTQYGVITTPEQYITVLNTGQLNVATDDLQIELLGIRGENESLTEGDESIHALSIDHHVMHIKGHKAILADPALRKDQKLSRIILNHIQEHIDLLRNTDPGLLGVLGEQPLPPLNGSPAAPQQPDQNINPGQPPQSTQAPQGPEGAPPGPGDMPNLPNMPKVNPQLLNNPALQQQAMGNVRQPNKG